MRIPSIAILCCCCCTHALLAKTVSLTILLLFCNAGKCEHLIKELDRFELIHDDDQSQYYKTENHPTIRQRNRRDGDNHDGHDDDHEDDHDDDHNDHSHSDDDPEASTPSPDKDNDWTTAQKWGYATLANSILGE